MSTGASLSWMSSQIIDSVIVFSSSVIYLFVSIPCSSIAFILYPSLIAYHYHSYPGSVLDQIQILSTSFFSSLTRDM